MDTVRMWMSSPAITTLHSNTLLDGRHLMQTRRIRRIPIVDEQGVLVGIVTEGDVNRVSDSDTTDIREYNLYHRIKDLPIREIMRRPVFALEPDSSILMVAQIMLDNRISGVPVTEHDQVVGIITESDLFRLIVRSQREQMKAST